MIRVKYIGILLLILSLNYSYSQGKKTSFRLYQDGYKSLKGKDTVKAIEFLKESISIKSNYRASMLLGDIYYDKKDTLKSLEIYKDGFKSDSSYILAYRIANIYFEDLSNYEKAEKYYTYFVKTSPKNSRLYHIGLKRLSNSIFAKKAVKNPVPFQPNTVGIFINKVNPEYTPTISSNQKMLIYTKMNFTKGGERIENLYYSSFVDSVWQEGIPLPGKVNSRYNEGAPFLSSDGRFIFFTGCNRRDGKGSCDIYFSILGREGWGIPHNLGGIINSRYWEAGASLSPNGKVLYFSSNRPGGKGGKDIWYSEFRYGKWKTPKNLEIINTRGDEETPFIHIDNKTLYFSSDGWEGIGKLDFFVSKKDSLGKWQEPKNLGYPINTIEEEYSLSVARDGKTAFFATNSLKGQGSMDIYYFELPYEKRANPTGYIKGYITNKKGNIIDGAKMSIYDIYTGKKIESFFQEDGKYFGTLEKNKTYAFQVIKKDYMIYSKNVTLKDDSLDIELDIKLKKIKLGEISELNNILFEYNKSTLKKESILELNNTIDFLKINNNISIEVGGHTDNIGSKIYNKKLSQNRAKSVYNYLIKKDINKNRLTFKGYGFSKSLNENITEDERKLNRRTELKVINIR